MWFTWGRTKPGLADSGGCASSQRQVRLHWRKPSDPVILVHTFWSDAHGNLSPIFASILNTRHNTLLIKNEGTQMEMDQAGNFSFFAFFLSPLGESRSNTFISTTFLSFSVALTESLHRSDIT